MSAPNDKAVEELRMRCFGARTRLGSAAAEGTKAVEAGPPAPGWKWNGRDWEYSSKHLNERHLRAVS
jgi:hypothetical protein